VSPSGHPSVRSLTPPPGPPSPDPLSRFSSSHACPAAHRESHPCLHFSGPRIAAAIYIPRDPQNSSQHRFPTALARSRITRGKDTFRNFIASVDFRNIRIYSGLYPLPVSLTSILGLWVPPVPLCIISTDTSPTPRILATYAFCDDFAVIFTAPSPSIASRYQPSVSFVGFLLNPDAASFNAIFPRALQDREARSSSHNTGHEEVP
jgi:hypothetical protein